MRTERNRPIDRVHNLSPDAFRRDYLSRGRPVVLTGITDTWRVRSWTPQYFRSEFPGVQIKYETWEGDEPVNDPLSFDSMYRKQKNDLTGPISEFVDRILAADKPSRNIYSAEFCVFDAIPQLKNDVASLDAYMGQSRYPQGVRDRLQLAGRMWMGPAGIITPAHFDRAENFHLQVFGRKKWILFSPEDSQHLYYPCAGFQTGLLHFSPVDVEHPDVARFPAFTKAQPIEVILEPGDLLFLPAGFWHYVRGLEMSISLNWFFRHPIFTSVALRHYLYHVARRKVLERVGLEKLNPEVRV